MKLTIVMVLLAATGVAHADWPSLGDSCDGDGLTAADARVGTMRRTRGSAGRGQPVIVGDRHGDLRCVLAFTETGSSRTWVRSSDIWYRHERRKAWTGRWDGITTDARITIRRGGGELAVSGDAVWKDGDNIHEGAFEGRATVDDGALTIVDSGDAQCEVRMRRVGHYLVVDDNRNCGGVNVSFAGVYRAS